MRNIGMISPWSFPPDVRIQREVRSLTAAGYRIFLLCERSEGQKEEEIQEGLTIRRIALTPGLLEKINYWSKLLTLKEILWTIAIKKFIADFKIELLHVIDLPQLGVGVDAAAAMGLPLLYDRRENWADLVRIVREDACLGRLHSWKDRTFISPERLQRTETAWAKKADEIIVVVVEAKERLVDLGLSEEKIHIVSNTEELDFPKRFPPDQDILNRYKDKFIVSYIGTFGPHRGLDTAMSAMKHLRGKIPDLRLLLVGGSPDKQFNLELKQIAADLGVAEMVEFTGWQPLHKFTGYIEASQVCLVPHRDNSHTAATIPYKLFQYMVLGKPVVASSCPPLARIVEETGCGLVFKAGDDRELAERIYQIYVTPDSYGERAFQAAQEKYNWSNDAQELLRIYQKLVPSKI